MVNDLSMYIGNILVAYVALMAFVVPELRTLLNNSISDADKHKVKQHPHWRGTEEEKKWFNSYTTANNTLDNINEALVYAGSDLLGISALFCLSHIRHQLGTPLPHWSYCYNWLYIYSWLSIYILICVSLPLMSRVACLSNQIHKWLKFQWIRMILW